MPRRARALVMSLVARGREAGTPDAALARRSVEQFLTELGYVVHHHEFHFNSGVYRAFPALGVLLAAVALVESILLAPGAPPWAALATLLLVPLGTALILWSLVLGDGTPSHARADANLIACRPGAEVRSWLVAHLDTKAQAQSMAGRLVAVWVVTAAVVTLLLFAILRLGAPIRLELAIIAGVLGSLAGVLLSRGRLAGASPGARDNGSGLLAVLTAAELTTDPAIGVIVTGAEEFGLAGARALVRDQPSLLRGTSIINVDTVDDEGTLFVVRHGKQGADLAARMRGRAAGLAPHLRERRLPLGIMVDAVPLARVTREAVTIARLSWGTLKRLHTPRDDASGYGLDAAEELGQRLAERI